MAEKSELQDFRQLLAIGGLPELGPGPAHRMYSIKKL